MRKLETVALAGFNDSIIDPPATFNIEINGRQVDYDTVISNTPAITSTYDGWGDHRTVLSVENSAALWDEARYYPIGKLASFHGRTAEVLADSIEITDEFGNEFTSLNLKGCNFINPYFMESETAERDFIIFGLQESIVVERIIRASKLFRENDISTEYICGLAKPLKFLLDKDNLPIDTKAEVELSEFLEYLAMEYSTETAPTSGKHPLEVCTEMIDRFKDVDYLITYRAFDVPFRFGELSDQSKYDQFKAYMQETLGYDEKITGMGLPEFTQRMFAPYIGENLGRVHKLGVTHKFLHSYNVSALGSIVDLDSCRGKAIIESDPDPKKEDYLKDVIDGIRNIDEVLGSLDTDDTDTMERFKILDSLIWSNIGFLYYYLSERFESLEEKTEFLCELLNYHNATSAVTIDARKRTSFSSQILTVYGICRREAKNEAHSLNPAHLDVDPANSHTRFHLYSLPPAYYRDNYSKLTDEDWNLNNERLPEGITVPNKIKHSARLSIENAFLELVCQKFDQLPDSGNRRAEFMDTLSVSFLGLPDNMTENPQAVALKTAFNQKIAEIVETLQNSRYSARLAAPADESELYVGAARLDPSGETPTSIDYVDTDSAFEYVEVCVKEGFKVINANQDIIDEIRKYPDLISVIADKRMISDLSESNSNTDFNTRLLNHSSDKLLMPLIIKSMAPKHENILYVFDYRSLLPDHHEFDLPEIERLVYRKHPLPTDLNQLNLF